MLGFIWSLAAYDRRNYITGQEKQKMLSISTPPGSHVSPIQWLEKGKARRTTVTWAQQYRAISWNNSQEFLFWKMFQVFAEESLRCGAEVLFFGVLMLQVLMLQVLWMVMFWNDYHDDDDNSVHNSWLVMMMMMVAQVVQCYCWWVMAVINVLDDKMTGENDC